MFKTIWCPFHKLNLCHALLTNLLTQDVPSLEKGELSGLMVSNILSHRCMNIDPLVEGKA